MTLERDDVETRAADREKQWRKVERGHYTSPRGRFEAIRDRDSREWMLLDTTGEIEPQWYPRWRHAREYVKNVEFADRLPVEIVEEEIRDEHHDVVILQLVRGSVRLGDIVVRRGQIEAPRFDGPVVVDVAEAFATALMLAAHRAAAMETT